MPEALAGNAKLRVSPEVVWTALTPPPVGTVYCTASGVLASGASCDGAFDVPEHPPAAISPTKTLNPPTAVTAKRFIEALRRLTRLPVGLTESRDDWAPS
jgi:hypothetical protein